MAGKWEFNRSDPSSVRVEVTQRDQFNNDDVDLAEALVREVIQNSSDAGIDNPVRVRFGLKELDSEEATILRNNIASLIPHLKACRIDGRKWKEGSVRALVIEDFNTKGLTGRFDDLDKDNFCNFWRAVGSSEKTGQQGGRWGLGKLVYSSSSLIRIFFGLTVRDGDSGSSIMGQAVLANHNIDNKYYPTHGFWFADRSDNGLNLQLPVQDRGQIAEFQRIFDLTRKTELGLSVIIPFLINGITEESIVAGVVHNYYFPILSGKLEVVVGDILISSDTFLEVAKTAKAETGRVPFAFVKHISDALRSDPAFSIKTPIGVSGRLCQDYLSEEQIKEMKEMFSSGSLVHLRVPVKLKPKNKSDTIGYINLFLEALSDGDAPFSLFARGPITLPGEWRHFTGVHARGAMITSNDSVAEFLGDAENPAHTAWNRNAEKLRSRWDSPRITLDAIRQSVRDFYGMISDQKETQDDDALIDFFSLIDTSQGGKSKKKRTGKPDLDVPRRLAAIRIRPKAGGFELIAGPGAKDWTFTREIRVRMAYDMIGADPFRHFSPFDFDLLASQDVSFKVTNGNTRIVGSNILIFEVNNPDFRLSADGFDTLRDLVVDARVLT